VKKKSMETNVEYGLYGGVKVEDHIMEEARKIPIPATETFEEGDIVIIVNSELIYPDYVGLAKDLGATKWKAENIFNGGTSMEDGYLGIVKDSVNTLGAHIVLIDVGEREFLINQRGILKVEINTNTPEQKKGSKDDTGSYESIW